MQESDLAMDIRRWLAELESPVAIEKPSVEPLPLQRQAGPVLDARRRRKRSSSDSSLLKAPCLRPRRNSGRRTEQEHQRIQDTTARPQSITSHSSSSESTDCTTASQSYARQPRRKTRLSKYEAGSKKAQGRDESQRRGRKGETRKSKRKSKRRKDERTHNGIGHNFQPRNVSKDRLTLKPLEKTGLFSKGKASTSAQSRGLPDLVFSEMRFLKNSHGLTAQLPDIKRKRKRDNARMSKDDISAFFTSARPALAEADVNISVEGEHAKTSVPAAKSGCHDRAREPSATLVEVDPALVSKGRVPCLSLGSRGPRHESTSYFSWSESICAPNVTPRRCKSASSMQRTHVHISYLHSKEGARDECAPLRQRRPSLNVGESVKASSEEIQRLSAVSLHSGPSRSQSLFQHSSLPPEPSFVDRATHLRMPEGITWPTSSPPMLQTSADTAHNEVFEGVGATSGSPFQGSRARGSAAIPRTKAPLDIEGDGVFRESPQWSTSPAKVLQHCDNVSEAVLRLASRGLHPDSIAYTPEGRRQAQLPTQDSYEMIERGPTIRFLAAASQPSRLPDISGPSFYVQQERRQGLSLPDDCDVDAGFDDLGVWAHDGQGRIGEAGMWEQEDAAGLPEETSLHGTMGDFDDAIGGLNNVAAGVESVQRCRRRNFVTSGFWRPNRLY